MKSIEPIHRGLRLPRGVTFTRTALLFDPDLTPEEWAEVGSYLSAAHRACGTWTGDWVRHGRANYDPQFVAVQMGQLELPLHAVEKFELQAQVAPESRREELTPEHHLVAAKRLSDPEEREDWLDKAARLGLSPRELQASIRAGEVTRIDEKKRRLSFPSPGAVRRAFDDWQAALGDSWTKTWTIEDCDVVLADLEPMAAFCERVKLRRDELRFGPEVEKAEKLSRVRETAEGNAEKLKGGE